MAVMTAGLPLACSDEQAESGRRSKRGESCEAHVDCGSGLACVGGVCSVGSFGLVPTGKECVTVECRTPEDCCPEPAAICDSYRQSCELGDTTSCTLYQQVCVCDASVWACEQDQCVEICNSTGALCTQTAGFCNGSRCVECLNELDCLTDEVCIQNECVLQCESDDECAIFHTCQNGACIETGCKNDRECVAATGHVLAICDANQECQIPCSTDLECDQPSQYDYKACISNFCVDVGCETNEECRVLFNIPAGADYEAECRVIQTEPPAGS